MTAHIRSRDVLPAGLVPRGLSRIEAAHYCGLGVTTFDRAVRERMLPKPFRIYGRWDSQTEAETRAASDSWADYS
jgi:predicted DNA-binding transcriptional regulator AlpA